MMIMDADSLFVNDEPSARILRELKPILGARGELSQKLEEYLEDNQYLYIQETMSDGDRVTTVRTHFRNISEIASNLLGKRGQLFAEPGSSLTCLAGACYASMTPKPLTVLLAYLVAGLELANLRLSRS